MTPDQIDAILGDFRDWLRDNACLAEVPATAEPVDLHTLVAQFTALRQEVNLHTRAVRQQQEQTAEALRLASENFEQLDNAVNQLTTATSNGDEQLLPLLSALIDVADTQIRAAAETARVAQSVKTALEAEALSRERPRPEIQRPSLLARIFGVGRVVAQHERLLDELETRLDRRFGEPSVKLLEQLHQRVEAAASGLAMGVDRIERIMSRHGLEPILAVGRPFEPELMEAVEVAADTGRPAGEIVEEIRRGYRLNGRIIRFAQVRVAK